MREDKRIYRIEELVGEAGMKDILAVREAIKIPSCLRTAGEIVSCLYYVFFGRE